MATITDEMDMGADAAPRSCAIVLTDAEASAWVLSEEVRRAVIRRARRLADERGEARILDRLGATVCRVRPPTRSERANGVTEYAIVTGAVPSREVAS